MKQLLQNLKSGETFIAEVPAPLPSEGRLLIETRLSLISAGTERVLVDFGKGNLLHKVKTQPDKVRVVADKMRTDGLLTTLDAVRSKLEQPIPLGYSNVGVVTDNGGTEFKVGDRVVSNGIHSDVVSVPKNLCARIPDEVNDDAASFTVLASIGLQGVRLASPAIGETYVVVGAGLIGLLTIQILRANGCNVIAIDLDQEKLRLAESYGATACNLNDGIDPIDLGLALTSGYGVDGVLITASTTSNDPVNLAAQMCRKRGKIILIGVSGLDLNRAHFYEKELTFQVSCSYGPGRYDTQYEDAGQDYPYGLVRWTEQRNFQAVLELMKRKKIDVALLVSHRFEFSQAEQAYHKLINDKASIGILLQYNDEPTKRFKKTIKLQQNKLGGTGKAFLGVIGAGNYSSRILLPALRKSGAVLHTIATPSGTRSSIFGKKFGFINATSDVEQIWKQKDIDAVVIATRHNSHAELCVSAMNAGKHVFVEKPLALTLDEMDKIEAAQLNTGKMLMVGFNRRFSPQVQTMKKLLSRTKAPKCFVMLMNAGHIPADHWTQNSKIGGGRIIGEACHHIDLMRYLVGKPIASWSANCLNFPGGHEISSDKTTINLSFEDGSIGSIHYFANGSKKFMKERIEVFTDGKTLQLENFIKLKGYGWSDFKRHSLWRQDKGQRQCVHEFVEAVEQNGVAPIPIDQLSEVTRASIRISQQIS